MIRKIIRIDKEKCNGCGACAMPATKVPLISSPEKPNW